MTNQFNQLCIWEGTVIGKDNVQEFTDWMQEQFGVRVKYMEEVLTLPTPGEPDTGGRNDAFFYIHDEDISKFAVPRFTIGVRWWEDVLGNGNDYLYTQETLNKYPKTW